MGSGSQSWLILFAGVLLGGGGAGGLLSAFFARSRDRAQAKALDNQSALGGFKDLTGSLQAQHVADVADMARKDVEHANELARRDARIAALEAQLNQKRGTR